jgi:hypothetical protein
MRRKALPLQFLFSLPILNGLAQPARGIAEDERVNIYFADIFHNGRDPGLG